MSVKMNDSRSSEYENLFAGNVAKIVSGTETLVIGNNLKRGAMLGYITANDKVTEINKANTNGSQNPYAILAEDANATDSDISVAVYYTGEFNVDAISFGDDEALDHKLGARNIGIFLKQIIRS